MEERTSFGRVGSPLSLIKSAISNLQPLMAALRVISLSGLLLVTAGCGMFRSRPTPTRPAPSAVPVQATAIVVLPTPPPDATLTAMVEAYRRTRTPPSPTSPAGAASRTHTPTAPKTSIPTNTRQPTATLAPAPIGGPAVHVVPEITEPGTPVEVRGSGWRPSEKIAVGLGASLQEAESIDSWATTRADGTFAATLNVPPDWSGEDAIIIAWSLDGQRRAVTRLYLVSPTETVPPTASSTATSTPLPPPTATPSPTFQGWRGEYYANAGLMAKPVQLRDDRAIDFDWGDGAPAQDVPADAFSVRWTRRIDFAPGGYHFDVQVDDGVRVFIDNQLVLDEWIVTPTAVYEFEQVLDGPAEVRVEYFDAGGNATIRFQWRYLGRYPNWRAAYYNNRSMAGPPALVRDDVAVNFNWGDESPAQQISADNFSARWTRLVSFDAGTYRFHARADDGVRTWVGDRLIIDEWHISTGETDYVADVYLSSGRRDVRIEYYEAGGKAEVHVWWENLDAYAGWRGAYFGNRSLSGQPAFVRDDTDIDFNWGAGGPDDIGPDDFSVSWTDRRGFESGTYRFFAEHDDGVRIWVDNALVLDEWYETGPVTHRGDVELAAGSHEIRVDYFEATGSASIRVWWDLAPYR